MKKAMVIVISSPSGGGKTSIVDGVLEKLDNVSRSISSTTREPRGEEKNGKDYYFVKEEEFIKGIKEDLFLEWEENFGKFYGTREDKVKEMMEEGKDVILNIDVKGAKRVKKKIPGSMSIFIMPPSLKELESRLRIRQTETDEQIEVRIKEAEREMSEAEEYDFLIINNNLAEAIEEVCELIERERTLKKRIKKNEKNGT